MLITYMCLALAKGCVCFLEGDGGILLGLLHVKTHKNPLYF